MKEEFLHYVWKFKKFDFLKASTTAHEELQIVSFGMHNQTEAGPDFFNAQIKINGQLWAGNVEIHLKSSDWYAHHHEQDSAYDNVILHVVWEHDVEVFRKNNQPIPTLVLKNRVKQSTINNYKNLLYASSNQWINCASNFSNFSDFTIKNWLERLYIERLEEKSKTIYFILDKTTNDWEAALFCLLAKNFGLNVNGEAFLQMALTTPFAVVRKMQNTLQMEALLYGQTGMLEKEIEEPYYQQLKKEYNYLKRKFNLKRKNELPVHYFRLRPSNFPTIRLSQLGQLFRKNNNLFSSIIKTQKVEEIKSTFNIEASEFWKTHYTFAKESKSRAKKLSASFINLLFINTIIPLKFCYDTKNGIINRDKIFEWIKTFPAEQNSITKGFNRLRKETVQNALDSQAVIQLKKNYCDKNHCLHCNLGLKLLQR